MHELFNIPNGWNKIKLKYVTHLFNGNSLNDIEKERYGKVQEGNVYISTKDVLVNKSINYDTGIKIPLEEKKYRVAPKSSTLLCIEGGNAGKKLAYTTQAVTFVNKLCCFVATDKIHNKFLYYFCNSNIFINNFNINLTGLIGGVSVTEIANFSILMPDLKIQESIVNFLDRKTTAIDSLVADKKKMVELLKEKRQAIITETVTKGLDKNAKMKPSGIEWLGKIPASWQVKKLKYTVSLINKKESYEKQAYVGLENIESNTGKYIPTETNEIAGIPNAFVKGDVLFGKLRPYLSKCFLANFSGVCSSEFLLFRNFEGDSKFLQQLLISRKFVDLVNSSTYGTKMPRASWDFIGQIFIPLPSKKEQEKISTFLEDINSRIDKQINDIQTQIEKLQEYRKSIISEAVTGKVAI